MTEDRDFEQEEMDKTRFDPDYDMAFNEHIDVPKTRDGVRVECKPKEGKNETIQV